METNPTSLPFGCFLCVYFSVAQKLGPQMRQIDAVPLSAMKLYLFTSTTYKKQGLNIFLKNKP